MKIATITINNIDFELGLRNASNEKFTIARVGFSSYLYTSEIENKEIIDNNMGSVGNNFTKKLKIELDAYYSHYLQALEQFKKIMPLL